MAHSTTKVSPGSTVAMNLSSPDSAYLMLPALLMRLDMVSPSNFRMGWKKSGLPAPRDQQPLDLADEPGQDQRENDGHDERREDLRNDVERARLEDGVSQPFRRRHEFADDRADQRETDGELQPRKDIGERRRNDELPEDLELRGAQRPHEI